MEELNEQPAVQIRLAEPSWPSVLETTLSIWLSRLLRRPYGQAGVRRAGIRWPLVVGVLVLVILTLMGLQLSGALSSTSAPSIDWPMVRLLLLSAGLLVAMTGSALVAWAYRRGARGRHRRIDMSLADVGVSSLTSMAAVLAGRQGPSLLRESDAHLAGNSGHDPAGWAKIRQAAGWVLTGARYRGHAWLEAAWRPVDVVLRSRFLSGLFVVVPTIVVAVEVLTHKGAMTVLTSWGSIFCVGTGLAAAVKAGRKYRDVQPSEPKARRAKE